MKLEDLELKPDLKVALISIVSPHFEGHRTEEESFYSLRELSELCRTLDLVNKGEFVQKRNSLDPATVLGSGKLSEISESVQKDNLDLLVFDFELTASQMRNIKKITGIDVMDRVNIILEIFAKHARTNEAKVQIEISKLEYLLPRLSSLWTHFTRQKGGIGLKGEGEQQLELDRRMVRARIQFLKDQLKTLAKSRKEQRKRREKQAITAALVGYTNAGKSSLMNRLCRVEVLSEDKLFATLDSTFRMLNPDTQPPMVLIDTVGFIQNLPSTLITGFKTTLESALEADLLIHVVDISDDNFELHMEVTKEVLEELGLGDKKRIVVFNKRDLNKDILKEKIALKKYPNSFVVSSLYENDITNLRDFIIEYFLSQQNTYEVFIPYGDGAGHSIISSKTNVLSSSHLEEGIFYKIRIPAFIYESLQLFKYQTAPLSQEN